MKFASSLCLVVLVACSCGPNQRILESSNTPTPLPADTPANGTGPPSAASSFEQDIQAMRNAQFNFIYVFRRKDGGALDADDKAFITRTTPTEMNRRRLADEGKAVIIGSNFRLPPEKLELFKQRFTFEDFSGQNDVR